MAVGRPPKPIEEHRRDGTRPSGRGVSHPAPTLIGERGIPDRPSGLDPEARRVWDLVVKDLAEGRVLTTTDWPAVEAFAVAIGRARQAGKAIAFERKQQAERRRKLPELWEQYERDMERFREGELKTEPVEPDVDPNPMAHLTQAGQKGSKVQSVYLQVEREAWKEARQVGDTLGLSPSARARLGLGGKGGRPAGASDGKQGVPESPRRGPQRVIEGGRG